MSDNKFKEIKDKVVGSTKEVIGKVTDNEKLETEGKLQQGLGKAREVVKYAADDVSDAAKIAKDKLVGGVKEVVGKVTGNDDLEFEGKVQKAQGKAREFANDDDAASKIKNGK